MQQTLVIYNLTAGLRRRSRLLKIIKKRLPRAKFELVFMNFENFLNHEDLQTKWQYDLVIVAGGDGTIRNVASFLLKHNIDTPIAIVQIGSANVLAQSLLIPLRLTRALDLIVHGVAQTIDVGCINGKYFFLEAFAMGYISERIIEAGRKLKSFFGFGGYLLSFLTSRKITQYFFEFTVDERHYKRLGSSLVIVNTQRLFGFEPKRPNDLRDGLFELTLATSKTFKEFIEG